MAKQFLFHLLIIAIQIQSGIAETFKCEKDGFFPDKRDCWLYHICVGSSHSVKACKDDLLFNPVKNECDWAMNVNCTNSHATTFAPPHIPPSTSNAKIPASDKLPDETVLDYLCQSVANDYVAHPSDCKQYAYCANGVPQTKICKKNLLWSQTERMCVWPAQSDCPAKSTSAAPPTAEPAERDMLYIPRGSVYPSSYVSTNPPASDLCPPTKSWRIPDPYDCSIYHDCYRGADRISYCPATLQYNPEKQKCDHAHNVQCKNKCTIENDGARFIDPASCCHFYECISGKLTLQTCPHPNLYDIQTHRCVSYRQVKCAGRRPCLNKCHYTSKHDDRKSSCDFSPSCAGHSNGFYLDPTKPNCQSYIQCLDYRVANYSRCASGQRFNKNMGKCTPADQVPCLGKLL
ncbi:unnamed protein product [Adineta ricciae]|uniref:Chitin-binding type-2 domain-containing protein n=1 Tax=Adineta ricciae TaxID=249248 RepID=A0A813TYT6_ADIRI|nr:unnamed protein product [Adineta ricciae]